jgi:glutamyl/glutaminyl-tRNA synthetase
MAFQPSGLSIKLWGVGDNINLSKQENPTWTDLATKKTIFPPSYRGRLAPSPTGYLHDGHFATFRHAWERARIQEHGTLILRMEDIDNKRCRPDYAAGIISDLRRMGLDWDEGPDCGGPCGPYMQSLRTHYYLAAWHHLKESGLIYPSPWSRKELESAGARRDAEGNWILPSKLRASAPSSADFNEPGRIPWRFRVPKGAVVEFRDKVMGRQVLREGEELGDFLVWSRDGFASYELAVVVDDFLMGITEVVRGRDLLASTARQILLYHVLDAEPPAFYHCPLVLDPMTGQKLSKRDLSPRYG